MLSAAPRCDPIPGRHRRHKRLQSLNHTKGLRWSHQQGPGEGTLCSSMRRHPPAPTHSRDPGRRPRDTQPPEGFLGTPVPAGCECHCSAAGQPPITATLLRRRFPKGSSTLSCTGTVQEKTRLLPKQPDRSRGTGEQLEAQEAIRKQGRGWGGEGQQEECDELQPGFGTARLQLTAPTVPPHSPLPGTTGHARLKDQ